jgi:hypothetical protein
MPNGNIFFITGQRSASHGSVKQMENSKKRQAAEAGEKKAFEIIQREKLKS